jgi:regulator of protease activity HflC (stomatin/prohibitin superfamily)
MATNYNDYFKKNNDNNNNSNNSGGNNFTPPELPNFLNKPIVWIIGILIILAIFAKPFVVINQGEVGILSTTGKFDPEPLGAGMHFYIPILQKVYVVDTKMHIINYKNIAEVGSMEDTRGGIKLYPAIGVLDARGLPVTIELTVGYRLNPKTASQTIATYGFNWEDKIINPLVRDVVRNIIGRFPAEELPIKRNQIATLINSKMQEKLAKLQYNPVILESVQLRQIILPEKIKDQILAVQVAKQQAQRVQYEVLRAKQEAQKRAALAKGVAEAKKIQAQGEADAITIQANAEAKANKLISESLTPELLKLKQIEVQGKFNEALKTNKDAKIFLTPGGVVPNLWIDSKNKQKDSSIR